LVRTLDNANQATVLAFSPDGRTLAVCAPLTDGAWLYDVATGAQRPFARGNFCCVWGAAFSPDNATLATAVTDGTVRLWDVASGKQTACLRGHRGAVGRVAWSPDGTLLASGGTDGMVRIWKVAKAANAEPPPKMVAGEIKRACLSRDGKWIVVTEPGGAASLHQWPSLGLVGTPRQIGEPLGFAPDATAVLSLRSPTNRDVTAVAWWGVPGLNLLKETTLSQNVSPEMACEVSPDGRWLAAGGKRNQLRVFDLADQGKLFADTTESLQDDGAASILAFSPNSRVLAASFTRSAPVYLWEPASTNGLFGFKGHASQALGLVFTSEGRTLLSGADTIRLWDVAGRGKLDSLPRASLNAAHGMDLSPDGKTLATTRDWEVQLWNLATHRQVGRFPTTGTVSALAFAPDGNGLFITTQSTNGPQTSIERAPGFAETDAPGAP
jgi:WD40 repeat protein